MSARVEAVVFDWAGTTVDFGSRAPVAVFREIFRRQGLELTTEEARGPMGRGKLEHIAALAALPRVAEAWRTVHGRAVTPDDVQRMYADFLPLQQEVLRNHADVIPGVAATVALLRSQGIRIGSTTGYTRALMEVLAPLARENGFAPDNVVCVDDVPRGRPAPWMLFRAAKLLDVYPMNRVVAVDDTLVGMQAGHNAQAWTVAVAQTGNALGMLQTEMESLDARELAARLAAARTSFLPARPHFTIDSVAELPAVIANINERLAQD